MGGGPRGQQAPQGRRTCNVQSLFIPGRSGATVLTHMTPWELRGGPGSSGACHPGQGSSGPRRCTEGEALPRERCCRVRSSHRCCTGFAASANSCTVKPEVRWAPARAQVEVVRSEQVRVETREHSGSWGWVGMCGRGGAAGPRGRPPVVAEVLGGGRTESQAGRPLQPRPGPLASKSPLIWVIQGWPSPSGGFPRGPRRGPGCRRISQSS